VKLRGHGIEVDLPSGWEGRIYRRPEALPILHAGNFALPHRDGDFGTRAIPEMRGQGVLVVVAEYDPALAGRGLFSPSGLTLPIRPGDTSPRAMPRPVQDRAGVQRFFTQQTRAFGLFLVVDTAHGLERPLRAANGVLASLRIAPPGGP
jgi:hypothetical protein